MTDPNALEADEEPAADVDPGELPRDVVDRAERLTRLERSAPDEAERRAYHEERADLLAEHGFTARVREEGDATLVLHPEEWHEEGTIRTDRIEDLSRAVEIPLEGAGDPDDWAAVDERNRDVVERVRGAHGDVHGENARVLADFFGNHYAKPIASATAAELAEFRSEYFVRNAWPTPEQRAVIEESIEHALEAAGASVPEKGA